MTNRLNGALALLLAVATVGSAQTPVVTRVIPEAAMPGDLVIVQGSNLAATTYVSFIAAVGGFTGSITRNQPVLSTSPTQVTAIVPAINGFLPPGGPPGSTPHGQVAARSLTNGSSTPIPFYFMEATFGAQVTAGIGTTPPTGSGRAVISFPVANTPVAGNTASLIELENAIPGLSATLVIGAPEANPFISVGDGLVAVDVLNFPWFTVATAAPTNSAGDAGLQFSIPLSASGLPVALQWATFTPGFGALYISNALHLIL